MYIDISNLGDTVLHQWGRDILETLGVPGRFFFWGGKPKNLRTPKSSSSMNSMKSSAPRWRLHPFAKPGLYFDCGATYGQRFRFCSMVTWICRGLPLQNCWNIKMIRYEIYSLNDVYMSHCPRWLSKLVDERLKVFPHFFEGSCTLLYEIWRAPREFKCSYLITEVQPESINRYRY